MKMTKAELKKRIKLGIDIVQDEMLLEGIHTILKSVLMPRDFELSKEDKEELDWRIARHKAGIDKGYTWEEVKKRIRKRLKSKKSKKK